MDFRVYIGQGSFWDVLVRDAVTLLLKKIREKQAIIWLSYVTK